MKFLYSAFAGMMLVMKLNKNRNPIKSGFEWYRVAYICIPLLIFAVYLNTANNHFYHRLHTAELVWPQKNVNYTVGNSNGTALKYVALGDSLTTGVGADTFNQSYSYIVAQKIVKPNQQIVLTPFATPGYKSRDVLTQYVDKAIQIQPDIITILIGVNDAHGMTPSTKEFASTYGTIVASLRNNTKARVYLIAIPAIGSNNVLWQPYRVYYSSRTQQFNAIIKDTAKRNGAKYIDLYTATKPYAATNTSYYSRDEFHPSAVGYAVWSKVIADDINR